jgi:HD-like signal output (HDOD) protein
VDDVAALLLRDPQLCAKLLQVANSAFFSRRGRTLDLRPAIVRLGMNTIRSLLLSVEVFDKSGAFAAVAPAELDMAQLEAQRLAELCERLSQGSRWSGQAYVVGLLADIGQLLLLLTRGRAWRECKSLALRQRRPIQEVERERLGVSHPEVGAYLLGLWGLPFGLAEAVAHHHTPTGELVAHFNLSAVVAIAAALQGRVTIDEPWLVGMKVRTKVELLRQSLAP